MNKLVFICAITLSLGARASSLCGQGEAVVFSCATSKKRMVSVCITHHGSTTKHSILAYRFGTKHKIELQIQVKDPLAAGNPTLYHYHRPGADKTYLSFLHRANTYDVFSEYDELALPKVSAGVVVSLPGHAPVEVPCITAPTANWFAVEGKVRCAKEELNACEAE